MKRRDFLAGNVAGSYTRLPVNDLKEPRVLAGLEKFTGVLGKKEAYHLLRRLTFNPTKEQADKIIGKTADEAVGMLLGTGNEPLPDVPSNADWVKTPEENPLEQIPEIRSQIEGKLWGNYFNFIGWLVELMRTDTMPSIEKLTLFWSTVWCIEFTYDTLAFIPSPLLLKNNQSLRKDRLANYKTMVEDMTLDGAMLLYQSLYYSSGTNPNENYMRELMELFTMGIGNYTEGDIKQGSRVLTGWRTSPYFGQPGPKGYFNTYFSPADHDIGAKTFMGDTIPARDQASNTEDQVLNDEVRVLFNIMFTRRGEAISKFIAEKIYRYFVYSNSKGNDSGVINELATVMVNNNFNLKPVFEALFTSKHFYESDNFGIQIKTPPEFIIGFQNLLGIKYSKSVEAIFATEQELYDPPNVGSWKAYRTWISTKTYPLRYLYAKDMLTSTSDQQLITLAKKFSNYTNMRNFITEMEEYFLPRSVAESRHNTYIDKLMASSGLSETEWGAAVDAGTSKAAAGIRALIDLFIKAPDFQLC